jgi:acyl-CoA thioester hydrolase
MAPAAGILARAVCGKLKGRHANSIRTLIFCPPFGDFPAPQFPQASKDPCTMPRIFIKQFEVGADAIDVMGHVNNQEYLRWMEEIAIEHSTAQGWPMERYLKGGGAWYVRSHFIEYLRPAMLGDRIVLCTWVSGMEERTSPRRFVFLRGGGRRQILARAETSWAFVDMKRGRSVPVPEEVRHAFEIVESEEEALREAGF